MADKKYFNHSFVSPCFALEMSYLDYRLGRGSGKMPDYASISGRFARCFAYFARNSGDFMVRSEITDCGKSEQNLASCYYLLVVKLVVIGNGLLLKVFNYFLIVGIFVPFTFTPSMAAPNSKAPPTIGTPYFCVFCRDFIRY